MGALAGGRRSDLPCCPLAPRQTEAGQRVALCRHCTDINTMAGKGWKMPLQAQSARGNVTGRNHLPNNAQETCQAGDLSLLVGTHLAAVTSQGFDKTSSRLRLHPSHLARQPPLSGMGGNFRELLLCSPRLWHAPAVCLGVCFGLCCC